MRARAGTVLVNLALLLAPGDSPAQTAAESQKSGAEIYRSACAACHGPDGKGSPRSAVGFDIALPDFTDCSFSTPEADADWIAVVHQGGRARAFDRMMPAFGDALVLDEIERVIAYVRSFCTERGWPPGDLNLPRPLFTEKAYPENELVVTTAVSRRGGDAIVSQALYERRAGRRGQYEFSVPLAARQSETGRWRRGIGDIAAGYKHVAFDSSTRGSILSLGGELVLPTGSADDGLGEGATIVEPFTAFSQALRADAFLHLHAGVELPIGEPDMADSAFWRAAVGRTWSSARWYRAWSPMLELLGSRELTSGQPLQWDAAPQMQISLSRRQHVLVNAGLRVPLNHRRDRGKTFVMYLLWDWFDGGFFSGW